MSTKLAILIAASLLTSSAEVKAIEPSPFYGLGGTSCGAYKDARGSQQQNYGLQYLNWISGFLAGYNFVHGGDIVKHTDGAGVRVWLHNYCSEHPTTSFTFAMVYLVKSLKKESDDTTPLQCDDAAPKQ